MASCIVYMPCTAIVSNFHFLTTFVMYSSRSARYALFLSMYSCIPGVMWISSAVAIFDAP
ncbi:MAG: hypothetical protein ACYTGM_03390 [Planctomycetota bacterium]